MIIPANERLMTDLSFSTLAVNFFLTISSSWRFIFLNAKLYQSRILNTCIEIYLPPKPPPLKTMYWVNIQSMYTPIGSDHTLKIRY